MKNQEQQLNDLTEIRKLMDRSSRFLSLSGLSGISAGFIALLGAAFAFFYLDYDERYFDINQYLINGLNIKMYRSVDLLLLDAIIVLTLAFGSALFFSARKMRKTGQPLWNNLAKRLLINLFIPLTAGGIFCLILRYHRLIFLIAPATLIFYGLALLNAGKYTFSEIRYLGISEIIIGLIASVLVGYGLLFWALGFGILHILYGTVMYFRHDRLTGQTKVKQG